MKNLRHNGFTLLELLIVIVVIGVLSAMMMLSSTEAVTSAKAVKIINNLTNLKIALNEWYLHNLSKVQTDGRVTIKGKTSPIQEFSDAELQLSKYLDQPEELKFNANYGVRGSGKNTRLQPGCYGFYDAGKDGNEGSRNLWYVGYYFKDDEDAVKDKVKKKAASLNLVFTDEADPWDIYKIVRDNKNKATEEQRINGEHAVWMVAVDMRSDKEKK